jgi:hypothetical protein
MGCVWVLSCGVEGQQLYHSSPIFYLTFYPSFYLTFYPIG